MINTRLDTCIESNNLLEWEQAGFRKGHSCQDQTYVLSSLIRKRLDEGLHTYCAFIDFSKCFDWMDEQLLLCRLSDINIGGHMLHCIRNIYNRNYSCVRLNGAYSPRFEVTSGVRQGDNLSPLLNNLVLDSLAKDLKAKRGGVNYSDIEISLAMYAGDLVLISETPEKLQILLNTLNEWCTKWQMKVNTDKSNVMDFRKPRQALTTNVFTLGPYAPQTVSSYKYLGYYLDEHLNFLGGCSVLSGSVGRSLSAIIHKMKLLNGERYGTC